MLEVEGNPIDLRLESFGVYGESCRGVLMLELPVEHMGEHSGKDWAQKITVADMPELFEGRKKSA